MLTIGAIVWGVQILNSLYALIAREKILVSALIRRSGLR